MRRIPSIKSVMTPFPYSVEAEDPVATAVRFMQEHEIHHLPVTERHEIVGVVSERDIRLMLGADPEAPARSDLKVRDVCVADPYVVDLNEPIDNVLFVMAQRHIGSVLVTRKGRLAGVFTATDVCRSFGEFLREHFLPGGGGDAA